MMRTFIGVAFVVTAVVLAASFQRYVVGPASERLEDGGFGELYGPVMFLRFVVYGICAAQATVGSLILITQIAMNDRG